MQNTTWIVAADSSRARLFEISEPDREVREIQEFSHPQGRAKNREINAEPDGRFFSGGGGPSAHTAGHRPTPVEHENQRFSKTLARYLDKALSRHRYGKLYLIAPPEFLGLMRGNLSEQVRRITAEEINKDLSWFDGRAIARYVKPRRRAAASAK